MVALTESNRISLWLCSGIVLSLCLLRLCLRRWRRLEFTRGDRWIMVTMAFTVVRMICGFYVMATGTPYSKSNELGVFPHMPTTDRDKRLKLAGKLDVFLRGVLVCIYWSLKMAVLDLAELLVHSVVRKGTVIYGYHLVLALTFVASIASIFVDCRPFSLNWQIRPNPGYCVQGVSWLYTYEIGNICTDAMLLVLPFPVLCGARIHLWKHLRLLGVFSLGLALCAVSIARVIQGLQQTRVQENRILYGAIETVMAAVVATTPTLYILLRPQSPRQSPNVPRSRHALSMSISSDAVPRKSVWSSRMSRSRPRSFGRSVSTWTEMTLTGQSRGGAGEGDSATLRAIRVQLEIDQASGHIDDAAGDTGDIGRQVRVNGSYV